MRSLARDNSVEIETDVAADLPSLFADDRLIREVLKNLLVNAVTHTPSGGVVRVSAGLDAYRAMVLTVADTGIGMSPDLLNSATTAFGGRSGLGLPLAKRFIELHDGTLTLDSTEGKGTVVTVIFPRARVIG